jgi:hypothetical protein
MMMRLETGTWGEQNNSKMAIKFEFQNISKVFHVFQDKNTLNYVSCMEACPKQHEGEMHNIIKLNFQSKKRHQS